MLASLRPDVSVLIVACELDASDAILTKRTLLPRLLFPNQEPSR